MFACKWHSVVEHADEHLPSWKINLDELQHKLVFVHFINNSFIHSISQSVSHSFTIFLWTTFPSVSLSASVSLCHSLTPSRSAYAISVSLRVSFALFVSLAFSVYRWVDMHAFDLVDDFNVWKQCHLFAHLCRSICHPLLCFCVYDQN